MLLSRLMTGTKTVLARPGDLYIGRIEGEESIVIVDASAGWMTPKGIRDWENEVSVVTRDSLTDAVKSQIKGTFPEEQIPPAKMPLAFHAASSSPLVAVSRKLIPELVAAGVRVHTIGADKTSLGFFYFAEGGKLGPVKVQGDLLSIMGPTLRGDESTGLIEQHLKSLIDRLLLHLSQREVSEIGVELAFALPRLNDDGTGLEGCDLEAFEKEASAMMEASKGWDKYTRQLAEALIAAGDAQDIEVPLFGFAKREPQFELTAELDGSKVTVARRPRWIVKGDPVRPASMLPQATADKTVGQEKKISIPAPAKTPSIAPKPPASESVKAATPAPSTKVATVPPAKPKTDDATPIVAPAVIAKVEVPKKEEAVTAEPAPVAAKKASEPPPKAVEAKAPEKKDSVKPKAAEEKAPEKKESVKPTPVDEKKPEKKDSAKPKSDVVKADTSTQKLPAATQSANKSSGPMVTLLIIVVAVVVAYFVFMKK